MRLYRICHARYLEDLRGLGANYRDGARWNEPGFPILPAAKIRSREIAVDSAHARFSERCDLLEGSYGLIKDVVVVCVVHTERGAARRIISARKATKKERGEFHACLANAIG